MECRRTAHDGEGGGPGRSSGAFGLSTNTSSPLFLTAPLMPSRVSGRTVHTDALLMRLWRICPPLRGIVPFFPVAAPVLRLLLKHPPSPPMDHLARLRTLHLLPAGVICMAVLLAQFAPSSQSWKPFRDGIPTFWSKLDQTCWMAGGMSVLSIHGFSAFSLRLLLECDRLGSTVSSTVRRRDDEPSMREFSAFSAQICRARRRRF